MIYLNIILKISIIINPDKKILYTKKLIIILVHIYIKIKHNTLFYMNYKKIILYQNLF